MNSWSRLQRAIKLARERGPWMPLRFGATVLTSIHRQVLPQLRQYLGLPAVEPRIVDIFQQIVAVDDDMRERLKVDVRDVAPRSSAPSASISRKCPVIPISTMNGASAGSMPQEGGWYYDMFDHPFKDATSLAEIEKYPWPDPDRSGALCGHGASVPGTLPEVEHRGIPGRVCAPGIMEMAAWTRGFANYFSDFANNEICWSALMPR